MKKHLLKIFAMCIITVVVLSSCYWSYPPYICDVKQVKSVEIVTLHKFIKEEHRYGYTVIEQVSDYSTFVNNLNKVEQSIIGSPPPVLNENDTVIKIDYLNGDYDLIHQDAQCFCRSGQIEGGHYFFEDDQFNALISGYLAE